jgi:hypothetical protein
MALSMGRADGHVKDVIDRRTLDCQIGIVGSLPALPETMHCHW